MYVGSVYESDVHHFLVDFFFLLPVAWLASLTPYANYSYYSVDGSLSQLSSPTYIRIQLSGVYLGSAQEKEENPDDPIRW